MDDLSELILNALAHAGQLGADQCEVAVNRDTGFSVTARLGEVETIERHQQQGLQVTVYKNHCKGSSATNDLKPQAIERAVQAAVQIAALTSSDPCAGLADPQLLAQQYPDLDLHHPWDITPQDAIEMAIQCEQEARRHESIANSEGATVTTVEGHSGYGNSNGFVGVYASSQHSISCSVVAKDTTGMQRDYWYSVGRSPKDLDSLEHIGQQASRRAVQRLGSRQLKTCKVPVLFEPSLARGLLGHFISAISGGALYRNASFLKDRLGEVIFPSWLSISERPHLRAALGSAPFDQDGVALKERNIVEEGVLKEYVLSHYSACRLGLQTTGNAGGIHNVELSASDLSKEDLIGQMNRGLLVTELIGHGVNTVTGDYSRGAAGFWIEHGIIQYPVEEITIAGNLAEMFLDIDAVGSDVDKRGKIRCGSLLVGQMMVAGN